MTTANPVLLKKIRYDELDAFRLFSAFCVVIIHVSASAMTRFQTGSTLQLASAFINGLALFAVPAFIGISALTIHLSYANKPLVLGSFYKKRVLTLMIPYALWTLIYYLDQLHFSNDSFSLFLFAKHLLLGTAFYHLYFMPIIFQFYLLYPLFYSLLKRIKPELVLILSLILFVLYLGNSLPLLSQVRFPWPTKVELPYSDRFFMSYLPFYALGLVMAQRYLLYLKHLKWLVLAALPIYLISEYSHLMGRINYFVYQKNASWQLPLAWEISSFTAIILLIALFATVREQRGLPQWIAKLSALTFTLYLAHPLILQLCEIKLSGLANRSLTLYYGLTFILCVALPSGLAQLIHYGKKKWLN